MTDTRQKIEELIKRVDELRKRGEALTWEVTVEQGRREFDRYLGESRVNLGDLDKATLEVIRESFALGWYYGRQRRC